MTINDIARMMTNADRYRRGIAQPEYPNGAAVSHPDTPDDGLDITGITAADRKIIPVSKEAEQTVRDMALEDMKKYYGMSGPDGNNLGNFIKSYYKQIPPSDRSNASWTLQQIHREEVYRLYDFVRSRIPGWQIGQKFDTSILDEYRQGVDVKA